MIVMTSLLLEVSMNDYCPWCSAPETNCPHWIGVDCELIEKEINFKALERYLLKVRKDE